MRVSYRSEAESPNTSNASFGEPVAHSSRPEPARSLLVAIHDVAPGTIAEVRFLRARLGRYMPPERIALLIIPNRWGSDPVRPGSSFARQLRAWSDEGTEMFVHGWSHRDDIDHVGARSRFKAYLLTAGEGEFLALERTEAARRMAAGRTLIEDITGRAVAGFVAPAWLYGLGALAAAADIGFALCEDHFRIWRPGGNEVLCHSPVICWASRSPARIALSRAAAFALRHFAKHIRIVRVAVHPGDAHVRSLVRSIDCTLRDLTLERQAVRYGDLQSLGEKAWS